MERVSKRVQSVPDAPLKDYLKLCPQYFSNKALYKVPLGASIARLDAQTIVLEVPRLQFFDVWLKAKSTTTHRIAGDELFFFSDTSSVSGSDVVKGLQLEDRYAISAEVQFREDADGSLGARSTVVIDVDLPEPFASINKLAGPAASGVLQNMVSLFLGEFCKLIIADYIRWSSSASERSRRQLQEASR